MKAISAQRRRVEAEPHRHKVRRGIFSALHWENLPWLEWFCKFFLHCVGLWDRGFGNVLAVGVERQELTFANLGERFDGLRILWISDLHIDPLDGLAELILERTSGLDYDFCVLGGDYCFDHAMTEAAVERMHTLAAGLTGRSAVYAILGNHDEYAMGQMLEAAGVRVLVNEHVRLERDGQTLYLVGVDDPHYYGADDLPAALNGVEAGAFTVLLCHSPEAYRRAAGAGIDLFLAGHTHGGQVCLPNGFAPVTCASVPRRLIKGLWRHEAMTGYTSRGAGASGIAVRFNCPGEITLLTLRKGL